MAFTRYKEAQYDTDGIPASNLSNRPKRFKIVADAAIAAECSLGGGIEVRANNGVTVLPIEIVASGTDLASGNLEVWVKLDLLTAANVGDPYCRIYYDGGETTTEDHAGVWSEDYDLSLHLEEDPSGSTPQMYDSVTETNVGTSTGSMTSGQLVTGQVGKALSFDGSDDAVTVPFPAGDIGAAFTLECLIYPSGGIGVNDNIAGNFFANGWLWRTSTFDVTILEFYNGAVSHLTGSGVLGNSAWQSVAVSFGAGVYRLYVDGVVEYTSAGGQSSPVNDGDSLTIGGIPLGSPFFFPGKIDEFRISTVARSADWLAYSYTDDFHNADTFTLSAELGGGGGGPTYTLAIDSGSYSYAGSTVGLLASRKLVIGSGSYTVSGSNVGLFHASKIIIGAGAYSLTGSNAGLFASRKLVVGAGSYIVTGSDVGLIPVSKSIVVGNGVYATTGTNTGLIKGSKLTMGSGSYLVTGSDVGLSRSHTFVIGTGSYTTTGSIVDLLYHRAIVVGIGSYVLTGLAVTLTYSGIQLSNRKRLIIDAPSERLVVEGFEPIRLIVNSD